MPPKVLELSFLFVFSFFPGDRTKKLPVQGWGTRGHLPRTCFPNAPGLGEKRDRLYPLLTFPQRHA